MYCCFLHRYFELFVSSSFTNSFKSSSHFLADDFPLPCSLNEDTASLAILALSRKVLSLWIRDELRTSTTHGTSLGAIQCSMPHASVAFRIKPYRPSSRKRGRLIEPRLLINSACARHSTMSDGTMKCLKLFHGLGYNGMFFM